MSFNLGLNLMGLPQILGGYNPPVDPPLVFTGYTQVNTSSISVDSIDVAQSTGSAPFMLRTSASGVSASGLRFSGKAIKPLTDLDFKWTVTWEDGSPIQYLDDLIEPNSGLPYNPYTDTLGSEGAFYIREAGTVKVTLTATGATGSGGVISDSLTETYVITPDLSDHLFYDLVNGSDSNDGLDPWGVGLSSASYTDATRTISAPSHGIVLDNLYPQNSKNYIHLTGHGLQRIESVTTDTITLVDALGADDLVSSSNGAKQNIGSAYALPDGTHIHLAGGSDYEITSKYWVAFGDLAPKGIWGYGAEKATIQGTALASTEPLVAINVGASGNMPAQTTFDNIILDAQGIQEQCIGGVDTSSSTNEYSIVLAHVDIINSIGDSGLSHQVLYAVGHTTYWGGSVISKRVVTANYTMAAGNTSGSPTLTVKEVIGGNTPSAGAVTAIDSSGETRVYHYGSYTGSVFSLDVATLHEDYAEDTPCFSGEEKRMGIYSQHGNPSAYVASVCQTISSDADNRLLDHYWYPNGANDHLMVHHLHAYGTDIASFVLNTNSSSSTHDRLNVSVVGGKWRDAEFGIDFGNGANDAKDKLFLNAQVINVNSESRRAFLYYACGLNIFCKNIGHVYRGIAEPELQAFKHVVVNGETHDKALFSLTIEDSRVAGQGLLLHYTGINLESYNNETVYEGSNDIDAAKLSISTSEMLAGNVIYFKENTQYTPSIVSSNTFNYNGSALNIADFNAVIGYTNYDTDPNWVDFPPPLSRAYLTLNSSVPSYVAGVFSLNRLSTDYIDFQFNALGNSGFLFTDSNNSSFYIEVLSDRITVRCYNRFYFMSTIDLSADHRLKVNFGASPMTIELDGVTLDNTDLGTPVANMPIGTIGTASLGAQSVMVWDVTRSSSGSLQTWNLDAGYLNGLDTDTEEDEQGNGNFITYVNTVAAEWSDNP